MVSLRLRHWLRASLWIVPLLCVLASIALSFLAVAMDRRFGDRLIPSSVTGTPEAVANILSTIATAMVTLTTLVLTVTTVAVQLAMGQFSPRIVRALLQDRASQLSYGLFASTFTFAIFALREVDAALIADQQGIGSGCDVTGNSRSATGLGIRLHRCVPEQPGEEQDR